MIDKEAALDLFFEEKQRQARECHRQQTDIHDLDLKLRRLCHELDMELDGVKLPASAAGILNGIRKAISDIDELCEDEFKDVPF
jgi:hypothetical protein